jgi:hypothetical protein
MNDFDRLLERDLASMLDPIVARPAPRRRRSGGTNPLTAVAGGLAGVPVEVQVIAEPAPVSLVVPAAPLS